MCPSDPNSPKVITYTASTPQTSQGFHGNYSLCAGSDYFDPPYSLDGGNLNGCFYWNSTIKIGDITDGTSNTLIGGEIIVVPDTTNYDIRGAYYNDAHGGSALFSTLYPPNTSVPDVSHWCVSLMPQAPCTSNTANRFYSLRSYHTGGVNALLGDGSVRFISNSVDGPTYKALGSRAAGEVPGNY
jgi:prepilin-type processing-associated H-X9-DG protein